MTAPPSYGSKIPTDIQRQLDVMVIKHLAQTARKTVPRGDMAAAESAFLSEIAHSPYAYYFPWLEVER